MRSLADWFADYDADHRHPLNRRLHALCVPAIVWAVIALAWVGQFLGHAVEGRRPSFFTDLAYLLVGPAWLMAKLLRRLGFGAKA